MMKCPNPEKNDWHWICFHYEQPITAKANLWYIYNTWLHVHELEAAKSASWNIKINEEMANNILNKLEKAANWRYDMWYNSL